MTIFLVDYENVHDAGMKYSDRIPEDSIIHLFYSNSEDKITLGSLAPIVSRLQLHKTRAGKQSLDMHLASYLGHEIGVNGADHNYVIVSKDRDYDNIAMFWCEHGIHVSSQGALVSKAEEPANPKPEQKTGTRSGQRNNRSQQKNRRTDNSASRGSAVPDSAGSEAPESVPSTEPSELLPETLSPSTAVLPSESATEPQEPAPESATEPAIESPVNNSVAEVTPEPVPESLPEDSSPAVLSNMVNASPVSETQDTAPEDAVLPDSPEQTAAPRRQQNSRYRRGRNRSGNDYRNRNRNTDAPASAAVNTSASDAPAENRRKRTPTPPSEKTLMNNRVMTKLTEAKLEAAVVGKATAVIMKKFGTPNFKQIAYRELIKTFGMKDGLSYYNIVKLIF